MIVVDTSVLAAFWVHGPRTADALALYREDPDWAAPVLWRQELKALFDTWITLQMLAPIDALQALYGAEAQIGDRQYWTGSTKVLREADRTQLSPRQAALGVLAEQLDVPLATTAPALARAFPGRVRLLGPGLAETSPPRPVAGTIAQCSATLSREDGGRCALSAEKR